MVKSTSIYLFQWSAWDKKLISFHQWTPLSCDQCPGWNPRHEVQITQGIFSSQSIKKLFTKNIRLINDNLLYKIQYKIILELFFWKKNTCTYLICFHLIKDIFYPQFSNKRVGWNKRIGWNFFFEFDKRVGKIWCCLRLPIMPSNKSE